MDLWRITYTSIITGERLNYMDVGFNSPESAKDEIKRLIRDAKKYKKDLIHFNINEMYESGVRIPSALIGKNWRIKKIKIKKL